MPKKYKPRIAWTAAEDDKLIDLIKEHGLSGRYAREAIIDGMPGRNWAQCKARWFTHLDPTIKKGPWSEDEKQLLVKLQKQYGNAWVKLAEHIPGRDWRAIKTRWHADQVSIAAESSSAPRARTPCCIRRTRWPFPRPANAEQKSGWGHKRKRQQQQLERQQQRLE